MTDLYQTLQNQMYRDWDWDIPFYELPEPFLDIPQEWEIINGRYVKKQRPGKGEPMAATSPPHITQEVSMVSAQDYRRACELADKYKAEVDEYKAEVERLRQKVASIYRTPRPEPESLRFDDFGEL